MYFGGLATKERRPVLPGRLKERQGGTLPSKPESKPAESAVQASFSAAVQIAGDLEAQAHGIFGPLRRCLARSAADRAWEAAHALETSYQDADRWLQTGLPFSRRFPSGGLTSPTIPKGRGAPPLRGPPAGTEPEPTAEPVAIEPPAALLVRLRLADALRPLQDRWQFRCLRHRTRGQVQLQRDDEGRVAVSGVTCCGSVWSCPICAPRIYSVRAGEIKGWMGRALPEPAYLLSLTIDHQAADNCREICRGLARAWGRFWSGGRASVSMRKNLLQVTGYVRGFEVTHGAHGWHPHFHVLLTVRRKLGASVEREVARLWQAAVVATMGPRFRPSLSHGADLRPTTAVQYLTKIGLEIASITSKKARGDGHETAWQIGQRAAAGDHDAQRLWMEYRKALKGSRQLTWSRGTKARYHIPELSDEQAAAAAIHATSVLDLEGRDWDLLGGSGLIPELFSAVSAFGLNYAAVILARARGMPQAPRDGPGG